MPDETCIVTRSFKLRGAESLTDAGEFVGWASVYATRDAYDDEIAPGCFAKSLTDSATRPLLWSHDPREPIGLVELEETPRGLKMRGKLDLAVARAREIHSLMRNGIVKGASIGFIPIRTAPLDGGGMKFLEAKLLEVSLTVLPANELAQVTAVKSVSKETKDMENVKAVDDKVEGIAEELRGEIAGLKREIAALDMRSRNAGGSWSSDGDFATAFITKWQENRDLFDRGGRARFNVQHPLLQRAVTRPSNIPMADSPRIGAAAGAPAGDLLAIVPRLPVSAGAVYVAREDSATGWKASPQVETGLKYESSASFTGTIVPVRTIATWVACSRQSLDDLDGLGDFVRARLLWALTRELEAQILSGSGAGENLSGLLLAAQNWVAPGGSWDLFGQLAHAAVQVRLNGYEPNAVVMHPRSALRVMLQRASDGQYIMRPPDIPRIVVSAAMAENQFLCGDFSQCVLRVRQDVTVDISTEHSDFFTRNMIAIRAEQRVALVTYSGAAFVKGTLQTSPAS